MQLLRSIAARLSHGNFLQLPYGSDLTATSSAEALRSLYPNHSLVMTQGYGINLLGFPEVQIIPLEKAPSITNLSFVPVARSLGTVPGVLVDQVNFGAFQLTWKVSFWLRLYYHIHEPMSIKDYEYIVYLIEVSNIAVLWSLYADLSNTYSTL